MIIATLTLPHADNSGQSLDTLHLGLRAYLCATYGRYTSHDAYGGWYDEAANRVIQEPVAVYTVAVDPSRVRPADIEALARLLARDGRQQAIMWTFDGRAHITPATEATT